MKVQNGILQNYCHSICLFLDITQSLLKGIVLILAIKCVEPLKHQTKIAAEDILIFYYYLSKKIRLDSSCEFS